MRKEAMKRLLVLLGASLLFVASPVSTVLAAPAPSYLIAVSDLTATEATFAVTRSRAGTDNDAVMWVHVECDQPTSPDELPVLWGTNANLTGEATLPIAGTTCTAWATASPWRVKHNDPSVAF